MTPTSPQHLRQAVDAFWETIPPFWHHVRTYIRQAAMEQYGITVEQFHILRHIRKGHASVKELAQVKQISPSAISQAVDVLVHQGLITRRQNEQDRRNVDLQLTNQADALLDSLFDQTRRWMMDSFSALDENELESFVQALASLKKLLPT